MKLRAIHIAPVIFVVFIAGIGGTMLGGVWVTESSKVPVTYAEGEYAGEYNPADIRGSYTFEDIENAFGVPAEDLGKAYGVSENPGAFQVKNLEEIYGAAVSEAGTPGEIGTDSVRWFVALYRGLPYTPEEDTLLPSSASSVLRGRVDEETFLLLKVKTASPGDSAETAAAGPHDAGTESAADTAAANEVGADHSADEAADYTTDDEDPTVKGKTTFGELLEWGATREEIEAVLDSEMGRANEMIRDFALERGIEFSVLKPALQELIDSKR